jgi:hypothetical protein
MAIQDFTAGQILTAAQMDSLQANDYNWTVSTKTASYTLVAADKGTRVVMNSASATTITVDDSLFSAGDTLFIQNTGAGGTCTITAGTATVTTAGSLALGAWAGGTLYFTSASAAVFFSGSSPAYGTATGGIGSPTAVTISGVDYEYLTFNATGTLTITKAGFFDYLLVSGGQSARKAGTGLGTPRSAGGGGGTVLIGSVYLDANQTITIGAGGALAGNFDDIAVSNPTILAATSPFTVTAPRPQSNNSATGASLSLGYSSGGSINNTTSANFTLDTGKRGGNSTATTNGGGGGGFTAVGGNGSSTTGGAGGAGFDVSVFIGGSALFKAMGGGGGGSVTGGAAATDGVAGGTGTTGLDAPANSGGGGGGGANNQTTGNGGSGIAYIRYKV